MKLIEVDPRRLLPNQRNLRRKPADLTQLKASIAHVGVLNPLHVTELGDGSYEVRHGDNRRLASLELELSAVPCLVPESAEEAARLDQAQHIFEMLAENQDRQGLTVSEEASGYAQLTLLDWSEADIAQFRGVPVASVKQSLALQRLPIPAHEKADAGLIGLDDVLLLAEFEDDPDTLQAILSRTTRSTSSLKHVIEDERRKRDHRSKTAQLRAELDAAGVTVVDKPESWPSGTAVEVSRLKDADGNYVRAQQVWDKPGFATFIDSASHWQDPRTVTVCLDPEAAGLRRLPTFAEQEEQRRAEREAAEQERAARQAALAAAAKIRVEWVVSAFGTAAGCKKILVDAVREAVMDHEAIECADDNSLIARIAGAPLVTAEKAKADRLNRLLVGRFLASQEENLAYMSDRPVHRDSARWAERASRYLVWLEVGGYSPSEAEQQLTRDLADAVRELRVEEDEDHENEAESDDGDGDDAEAAEDEPWDDEPAGTK